MAHTLFIYDIADFAKDSFGPKESRDFTDVAALRAVAFEIARAANHPFVVAVRPDPALCADIPAYVAISNLRTEIIAAGIGSEGCFETVLMDDVAAWAESGITTPAELHDYLGYCADKEIEEAAW